MTLRDNCHRLTKTHLTIGPKGPISVPALLDQLEAAVSPSSAGGATGSAKIRLPLDATALSLLQDIRRGRAGIQMLPGLVQQVGAAGGTGGEETGACAVRPDRQADGSMVARLGERTALEGLLTGAEVIPGAQVRRGGVGAPGQQQQAGQDAQQ